MTAAVPTSAVELVNRAANRAWTPPPTTSVSEWSEENVILGGDSPVRGVYRVSKTPYVKEIMDCLSPYHPARWIVWEKGTQVGGTRVGLNWVGFKIDSDPATMIITLPSEGVAKEWSNQRLSQLVDETPCLAGKIEQSHRGSGGKGGGNTMYLKKIKGTAATIKIAWSSSAKKLRSTPAQDLLSDEVDGFEGDVEGEGDPIALLNRRFTNFPRGKHYMTSTPTHEPSRIQREFENGDQRYYFLPCPHCGHYQRLEFPRLNLRHDIRPAKETAGQALERYASVAYICLSCKGEIHERHKTKMLTAGVWVATDELPELVSAGFPATALPALDPAFARMKRAQFVSFHLSAMYSPVGWYSWAQMAKDWEGIESIESRKSFINTVLAETWSSEPVEATDDEMIWRRRDEYQLGVVPMRGLFLTAFVDVQETSLHFELKAWGRGKENWSVHYQVIQCETEGANPQPIKTSSPEPWIALEDLLRTDWPHESGKTMPIYVMGIDSGFRPQMAYAFAGRHPKPVHEDPTNFTRIENVRSVACTKGESDNMKLIHSVSKTEAARVRGGIRIWHIGTGFAKQEMYDSLNQKPPEANVEPQAGRCHYPYPEHEFYKQLCSETRHVRSGKVVWVKDPKVRNEPVDTHVGNRAMAALCGIERFTDNAWLELERRISPPPPEPVTPAQKPKTGAHNSSTLYSQEQQGEGQADKPKPSLRPVRFRQ